MADRKVLVDRSQSGKVRPWREHKLENLQYGDYLQMLHYKKAHRVKECGEVLRFVEDKNGHKKLAQTWFCLFVSCFCRRVWQMHNYYGKYRVMVCRKNRICLARIIWCRSIFWILFRAFTRRLMLVGQWWARWL